MSDFLVLDGPTTLLAIDTGGNEFAVFDRQAESIVILSSVGGGGGGGGSAPITRAMTIATTPSLARFTGWKGVVTLGAGWRLYRISCDREARIRMYATAAQRDADEARGITVRPVGNHGLLFDYVAAPTSLSAVLSPVVDGAVMETVVTGDVPVTIENQSLDTSPVVVTFTYISTEPVAWDGSTGPGYVRSTAVVTTPVIQPNTVWQGLVTLAAGWRLYRAATDCAARVRLYATVAQRDTDVARWVGDVPAGDHGLLFEQVTTPTQLSSTLSPMVDGAVLENYASTDVPVSITNLSGVAAAVTATLTYLRTE